MSQQYVDDCYAPGHQAQTDLQSFENNFACLKSSFSGANAPPDPIAGMWWLDTTAHILKQRNEANNAWLNVWDMANNKPVLANIIVDDIPAAMKDPAVGTAGLRTLGTGAQQALPGNTNIIPPDGSITGAKLINVVAGDSTILLRSAASVFQIGVTYTKKKEIQVKRAGVFRVSFELKSNDANYIAYGRIYKNGGELGTERSTQEIDYVKFSEDLTFAVNDLIQIYIKSNNANYVAHVQNFELSTNDPLYGIVNL